jgi:two-component system, NarL family, sensor kinase
MPLDERLAKRIVGSFVLGILVALINYGLDVSFIRLGVLPATTVLNDLIIGAAAGWLAYFWMARQAAIHAQELSAEKLLQEAVHNERKRIAFELHDTVCQAHTGAVMHLECAGDSLGGDLAAREHLHRALQLVRGSMTEMRCALWDLYPEELQKADLRSAIESLVKDLTAGNGLSIQFSLAGMIRRLPPETEKGLLRISQEALSNVVKHAQAREVRIELFLDSQRARLCVKDDGQGFVPKPNPRGFGLTSMEDRTKALGGVWTIHSEPGRGTEVHASIPIPPATN